MRSSCAPPPLLPSLPLLLALAVCLWQVPHVAHGTSFSRWGQCCHFCEVDSAASSSVSRSASAKHLHPQAACTYAPATGLGPVQDHCESCWRRSTESRHRSMKSRPAPCCMSNIRGSNPRRGHFTLSFSTKGRGSQSRTGRKKSRAEHGAVPRHESHAKMHGDTTATRDLLLEKVEVCLRALADAREAAGLKPLELQWTRGRYSIR